MISQVFFKGVLSSGWVSEAENLVIGNQIGKFLEVAKMMLLPFFIIRISVQCIQFHLSSAQLLKAGYMSVLSLVTSLLLLHYYMEIFNFLDQLTIGLMKLLDWRQALKSTIEPIEKEKVEIWQWITNRASNITTYILKGGTGIFSVISVYFRKQLIVFTLRVGPIAIAASLLPGNFSHIAIFWFNSLLSFLMWGVTLDILDSMVIHSPLDTINGLASAIVSCMLYGMIGPLTSIWIGNTIGNSLFATSDGKATRLIQQGTKFLSRGTKWLPKFLPRMK